MLAPGEYAVNGPLFNVLLVLFFILLGAFFVAAEIALVSLRDSQIRALASKGRRGERVAQLASNPNRFLSAVQIGVTFTALLSAAFGAESFADQLQPFFEEHVGHTFAKTLALLTVTVVISYFALVLGELTPKRIGLQRAESVALALAPAVDRIAVFFRPVIWLLSKSTDAVVRLVGGDPNAKRDAISEEELRELVAAHETLSVEERQIVEEVFTAGDRQIREVMIPRTEVDFLEARTPVYKAAAIAGASPHSRYPVVDGSHDNVVGFVHIRDLLTPDLSGRSVRVQELTRDVKFLPSTKRVLAALSEMRRESHHLAIVLDEYGGTYGIVTLEDLVEELVGDIRDEYDPAEPVRERLAEGSIEVEGLLNLDDFAESTGVALPEGPYETVAGYVMFVLGRIPIVGDTVRVGTRVLTVSEVDGRRISRVVVSESPEDSGAESAEPDAPVLDATDASDSPTAPAGEARALPAPAVVVSGATAADAVSRPRSG